MPYIGNVATDICQLMNGPPLTNEEDEVELSWYYALNVLQAATFLLTAFFYMGVSVDSETNPIYILFLILTVLLVLFDDFDEGSYIIPLSKRMRFFQAIFGWC